jgi:hypothetical protein
MVCTAADAEAILQFDGVAVAVQGRLIQEGGRAAVWLDGRHVGCADAYMVERTHDDTLWHTYGLKSGHHTLKLVTTGKADPRSKGTSVGLGTAVIYRAR